MVEPLHAWREEARQLFRRCGLPGTHQELWKYTDLEAIHERMGSDWRQGSAADSQAELPAELPAIEGLDALRLVIFRGRVHPCSDDLPAGVDIVSWAAMDALTACERLPAPQQDSPLFHAFDPLNAALMQDGLCLRMAAGVTLDKPLLILHLHDDSGHSHVRHRLHLGKGAKAEVISHDMGVAGTTPRLRTSFWQWQLEEDADASFSRIQQLAGDDWQMVQLHAEQAKNSRFSAHSVELGGERVRLDAAVRLTGEGAETCINGLLQLAGQQHVDHHVHVAHEVGQTHSEQNIRSVLDERSHAVCSSSVHVHAGASGSDAEQHSDHLLLSRTAEVDTKPELEIDHDDVRCSHGATVGQLSEEQRFYLRSRGISEAMSQEMLIFAFADALLARLPNPAVRRYVERQCFARLPHSEALAGLAE